MKILEIVEDEQQNILANFVIEFNKRKGETLLEEDYIQLKKDLPMMSNILTDLGYTLYQP